MTSQAKIDANRRNCLKSTGPKTPEGRERSSMNSLKHGMRSKKMALRREDSYAFENRLRKWTARLDPEDDIGEFLIYRTVFYSFEIEYAERAHIERLDARIENSEEELFEEVLELGKRLFFDPSGPTQLYGNEPDCRGKVRTSWTGEAINPNDPGVLVRKLESTALGCCWMRDRWEELRHCSSRANSGNPTIASRSSGSWAGSRSTPTKINGSPRSSWPATP